HEFVPVPDEVTVHGSALRHIQHDDKGTVRPAFRNMSLLNFSPRFGFAWNVTGDGKTAVRGGFAELYDVGVTGVSMAIAAIGTPPFSSFSAVATPTPFTLPFFFPSSVLGKSLR